MNHLQSLITFSSQTKARVAALLGQCDALAAQRHQTGTLGAHLLVATLHQLLAA